MRIPSFILFQIDFGERGYEGISFITFEDQDYEYSLLSIHRVMDTWFFDFLFLRTLIIKYQEYRESKE